MTRYYLTSGIAHFIFLFVLVWSPWMRNQAPILMIDGLEYLGEGGGGGGGGTPKEKIGQVVPNPVKIPVPAKPAPIQHAQKAEKAWAVKDPKKETEIKKETAQSIHIPVGEKDQAEKSNITLKGVGADEDKTNYFGLGEGKGAGIGIGTGEGMGGGTGGGFPSSYLAIMRRKIWSEWTQSAVYGAGLDCIVGLTVMKNGEIKSYAIEKSSNNSFYDNVALRAVRNASPLPPLPSSFPGSEQRFRIKFVLLE